MRKTNKNKKLNSIILKSFIVIAVMMISVMPSGGKNITKITKRLISCYNCYKLCR